jgi:hypothetical protein
VPHPEQNALGRIDNIRGERVARAFGALRCVEASLYTSVIRIAGVAATGIDKRKETADGAAGAKHSLLFFIKN